MESTMLKKYFFLFAAVLCQQPRVIAPKISVTGAMNGHNTTMQQRSVMQKLLFTFVVRLLSWSLLFLW